MMLPVPSIHRSKIFSPARPTATWRSITLAARFPVPLVWWNFSGPIKNNRPMSARLDVKKTYKLYLGGKFPRSESGRYLPAKSAKGEHLDNFAHASRKDFRDAVGAARAAVDGWSKATAYNRGQILYRAAEMLQNRAAELVAEIARSTNVSAAKAKREVTLAVDRLVHFAGWTDKYSQVFSSVNPVASSHFNFSTPEPMGVVVVLAPDEPC